MGLEQDQQAFTGNTVAVALVIAGIISLLTLGTAFALLILDVEFFWSRFLLDLAAFSRLLSE
jgi:hypothetical protein